MVLVNLKFERGVADSDTGYAVQMSATNTFGAAVYSPVNESLLEKIPRYISEKAPGKVWECL